MKKRIARIGFATTLLVSSMARAEETMGQNGTAEKPTFVTQKANVRHATGFVRQEHNMKFLATAPKVSFTSPVNKVPKKYSLRHKAGPVENQGQCGSCWDFALTTTLRGSLMTQGKDPGRLSFNYLLNCDKAMQGCSGGDFAAADLLLAPLGAPKYGSDGRYHAYQGKCVQKPAAASALSYKLLGKDGNLHPSNPDPSFQDIAYVVGVLHQPVAIDVTVVDSFQTYGGGTYNDCIDSDPKDINHMVVIEGYDCEKSVDKDGNCAFDANGNLPPRAGKWLIRNSWGPDWGDSGYITFRATDRKGRKCDGVATDALFFDLSAEN